MKKRLLSITLALLLLLSCAGTPALADSEDAVSVEVEEITEETAVSPVDEAADETSEEAVLTRLILSVREQLNIDDHYTSFTSSCADYGLIRYWELDWADDAGNSVSVTADDNGTVYTAYFYYSDSAGLDYDNYVPAFPDVTSEQLQSMAAEFIAPMLEDYMTVEFNPVTLRTSGTQSTATVSGTVYFNGVKSDLTISVRYNLASLRVTRYYRSDSYNGFYSETISTADSAVTEEAATELLDTTWSLSLQYMQQDDGTIGLWYVPAVDDSWYVDAQTGVLTSLDAVWETVYGNAASGYAFAAEEAESDSASISSSVTLSAVEGEAVEQIAGTLTAAEVDSLLRQLDALGLADMTTGSSTYQMAEDGSVTCSLVYTRVLTEAEVTEDDDAEYIAYLLSTGSAVIRKTITVDAVTGQLLRVSTSDYMAKDLYTGDTAAVAAEFLETVFPEEFAACKMNEDGTRWIRTENGIPYTENSFYVSVSSFDGSIRTFYYSWDADAEFPAPDGILTEEAAAEIFAASLETVLQYIEYPEAVDTSTADGMTYYMNMSSYTYCWLPVWKLENLQASDGVDAFTGALIGTASAADTAVAYTDLSESWAQEQIETLASFGIVFGAADTFAPAAQVTQVEMLLFLLNAVDYAYDADSLDADTVNEIYAAAYDYGLLTAAERDPDRLVTRMEFLQTILNASAYAPAAALTGIYQCSFADAAQLDDSELAYAAIAEGLGLVSGDGNHNLNPDRIITRQEAAVILYNYMNR